MLAITWWHHGRLREAAAAFAEGQQIEVPTSHGRGSTLQSLEQERLLVERAFPLIVQEDLGDDVPAPGPSSTRSPTSLDLYGAALVSTFSCSPAAGVR